MNMLFKTLSSILFYSTLLLLFTNVNLYAQQTPVEKDTLLVGVAGSEPFVYVGGREVNGIAEEIWEELAAKQDWNYSFESFNTVDAALHSLEEGAISKLKKGDVVAVVYDRPQLLYYLKKEGDEDFFMAKAEYYKQGYGFAFPLQSTLVFDVNRVLLEMAEDQETDEIIDRYLRRDE